jgi:hypothetical protein
MKTMLLAAAAAAALGLGIGAAYAGDGAGPAGGYAYPGYVFPGAVYAGAETPVRHSPAAAAQNDQAARIYGTHSQNQGVWLFPPNPAGGGSN